MNAQARYIVALAALAASGCATRDRLDIRPIDDHGISAAASGAARIALAHGQLALGNVALALEGFRRAEREAPGSAAALAGIAECYRLMGRPDLARQNYEKALAIAPAEPSLYLGLARALGEAGQTEAAGTLRREAAALVDGKASVPTVAGSMARLPEPLAVPVPGAAAPPATRPTALPRRGTRLERLSPGEVALVTDGNALWTSRRIASTPRSVTIRFEHSRSLVVLNAARIAGIAARTRDYLAARGFRAARIGDAPSTSAHSRIQFPSALRGRAERIAAQFPFPTTLEVREGPLTLIVGRNAAGERRGRTG